MDNTNLNWDDVEVIDPKDMFFTVCQKWRKLILVGVIGLVIGAAFGAYQFYKEPVFDMEEINEKQVEQYARYQQMYDDQLAWEQESVYLNIDPYETYTTNVQYLLRIKAADSQIVSRLYSQILNNETRAELIEVSGLDCTVRAMSQLVGISYTEMDRNGLPEVVYTDMSTVEGAVMQNDTETQLTARITVSAVAPSQEVCDLLLAELDSYVQDMNTYVASNYAAEYVERIETPCTVGYNSGVIDAKKTSTEALASYANKLESIEKDLSDDDLLYYTENYPVDEEEKSLAHDVVKWAVIIGVLLGAIAVCYYAAVYLLDGKVKTMDELLVLGLHPFAVIKEDRKKHNAIDRLFTIKYSYNSNTYLAQELTALGADKVVLCGNMNDAQIKNLADDVSGHDGSLVSAELMNVDANTQRLVKESGGVVFLVHLKNTARNEIEQEIRICQKIGGKILGVAAIG